MTGIEMIAAERRRQIEAKDTGINFQFYLGQRVRITADHARGHLGKIFCLDSRGGIEASIVLDEPIIIPAFDEFRETYIHTQTLSILDIEPVDEEKDRLLKRIANLESQLESVESGDGIYP